MSQDTRKHVFALAAGAVLLMGPGESTATASNASTFATVSTTTSSIAFAALADTDANQRYRAYLKQAGFRDPDQLGKTKTVVACDVRAFQGAVTFNRGLTERCVWQQSEPGWVIQSVSLEVKENFKNRGRYSHSIVAENGQFFMNAKDIGDKWKAAIDAAAKVGDIEVKRRLEVDYQRHMERLYNVSANKNTIYLDVTANGGLFARSWIRVVATATLIRVE